MLLAFTFVCTFLSGLLDFPVTFQVACCFPVCSFFRCFARLPFLHFSLVWAYLFVLFCLFGVFVPIPRCVLVVCPSMSAVF